MLQVMNFNFVNLFQPAAYQLFLIGCKGRGTGAEWQKSGGVN
jgi:hypothetical protein